MILLNIDLLLKKDPDPYQVLILVKKEEVKKIKKTRRIKKIKNLKKISIKNIENIVVQDLHRIKDKDHIVIKAILQVNKRQDLKNLDKLLL